MLQVGGHLHSEKGGVVGILDGGWSLVEAGESLAGETSSYGAEGIWEAGVEDGWKMEVLTMAEEGASKTSWSG